ncbi:MAG TPA: DUF748 domain-containing protein [Gammaproteobacteria bacterium]
MRTRYKWLAALAVVALALVALRLALPSLVLRYANARIASMGEYSGHVEDVGLSILRGAYVLRGVTIVKPAARVATPFLDLERMDVSVQWNALLRGRLVGELLMQRPVVNMVQGETDEETQLGAGVNWPAQVRELFPFHFNRVEVRDGTVTFRAPGIEAEESLTLREARIVLLNLTNVQAEDQDAYADIELEGRVMGNAPLMLAGRIDPNAATPTFDVDLTLEGARLVDVNPWLRQFLNVDAEQGTFTMYAELAAAEGRFQGYIKPLIENPQILSRNERSSGPFQKAWEGLVELATNIFKNRRTEQVATQVPFAGELEDPSADVMTALVNLLRNAFVAAFSRSLEGTVSLRDVAPGADENPAREENEN